MAISENEQNLRAATREALLAEIKSQAEKSTAPGSSEHLKTLAEAYSLVVGSGDKTERSGGVRTA